MKALSIRQPWAWLIVHGHKSIENRSWRTNYRGPVLIHASKGMTKDEYITAYVIAEEQGVIIPDFKDLLRGGIVGKAVLVDCINHSYSPWFFGPHGFVMQNAKPLEFQPCPGALNFFTPVLPPVEPKTDARSNTICDNCGQEVPVSETRDCACGKTLCPECICEECD